MPGTSIAPSATWGWLITIAVSSREYPQAGKFSHVTAVRLYKNKEGVSKVRGAFFLFYGNV
jgi:hypothetical protein